MEKDILRVLEYITTIHDNREDLFSFICWKLNNVHLSWIIKLIHPCLWSCYIWTTKLKSTATWAEMRARLIIPCTMHTGWLCDSFWVRLVLRVTMFKKFPPETPSGFAFKIPFFLSLSTSSYKIYLLKSFWSSDKCLFNQACSVPYWENTSLQTRPRAVIFQAQPSHSVNYNTASQHQWVPELTLYRIILSSSPAISDCSRVISLSMFFIIAWNSPAEAAIWSVSIPSPP